MQKFILLADSDEKVTALLKTALKYFYRGEIYCVSHAHAARELIGEHGAPELMVSSLGLLKDQESILYNFIAESDQVLFPLVAMTEQPLDDFLSYPVITNWLTKPLDLDHFLNLARSFLEVSNDSIPSHVSVEIESVLMLKSHDFDLHLRLSGNNYVKIISRGDEFTFEDAAKLRSKGIHEVYIKASESFRLLKAMELRISPDGKGDPKEEVKVAIKNLEQVERIARSLGWTEEVLEQARSTVKKAMVVLGKDHKIVDLLNEKLKSKNAEFSDHIGLLTFLLCTLSSQISMPGENGPMKLALASLLHDVKVEDSCYDDVNEWNKRAANLEDRTPETVAYRFHPIEAAKIAQSLDTLPPDVDRIILQHHERPDGTGFPRSLTSSRITFLAAVFIITEELSHFLQKSVNPVSGLKDFLTWGETAFDQGNFKRIFQELKKKIEAQL